MFGCLCGCTIFFEGKEINVTLTTDSVLISSSLSHSISFALFYSNWVDVVLCECDLGYFCDKVCRIFFAGACQRYKCGVASNLHKNCFLTPSGCIIVIIFFVIIF